MMGINQQSKVKSLSEQEGAMARPLERTFIALVVCGSLAITIVHSINSILIRWFPTLGQTSAAILTWAVIFVSVGFALGQLIIQQSKWLLLVGILLSVIGSLGAAVFGNGFGTASLAIFLIGIVQTRAADRISSRLPVSLDGAIVKHPLRSFLWTILGILLLIQTGRLGTYMADPSVDWWLTTRNEWWAKHMCMPAYIQAADYNRQGEGNIYDERHYPAITRNAKVHLAVQRMDAFVGDPYQYPPQFLIFPSLALWLTNDFLTMRTVWYSLQMLGFVLVAVLLAWWVRSEAGWTPMLLIPVVLLSVPAMQCLQFGQFHLATIVLAVAGMLAFERERHALGGILLAVAILSKLFPAILLIPLVIQRRWKSLAWTIGFAGLLTLVALTIVGTKPFSAFVNYQLPRLSGGDALAAFTREWPELREMVTANVISLYGVVLKLHELGVPGMSDGLALWIMRLYSVLVFLLALLAGRTSGSRLHRTLIWFALLNLAALQTSLAWGDYVTVGSVWLLSLMAVQKHRTYWHRILLGACWVFTVFDLGIVPMPTLLPTVVTMTITSIGAVLLCVLNGWVILREGPKPQLEPLN